ncbi:MAG: MFS transporter [Carbonactinosporaceae bacterium]
MVCVPQLLADLTPLRVSAPYRRMWLGASLSGVGTQLTTVAVGLQVYDLTGSTFHVGLVGLFAVVPLIALGLYGGSIVDANDRRRVIIASSSGLLIIALAMAAQAWLEVSNVWLLYALVAAQNGCFAVNTPTRSAIVPRLLPAHLLPAANALSTLSFSIGMTAGPLLAGLLVGWWGYGGAYTVEAVLLVVALTTLVALPPLPPEGAVRRAGLASVLEGLRYLGTRANVRMTFLVDLSAMVLAMPRVVFPAVGAALIGGGAATVGLLAAGIAAGSIVSGVLSGPLGHVRRQGLAVLLSVACWGLAVTAFGVVVALSPGPGPGGAAHWTLWPALGCMALAGAADAVSSVFRMTILQAATPDSMRGRLQGIFVVVVAGGPRLGDLLLGSLSQLSSEAVAAIAGGLACVATVTLLALAQPRFARYDACEPTP